MKNILSLAILFWILGIGACEKSDPRPDDCKGSPSFEADFSTFETVGDSLIATDKVLLYSSVTFQAAEEYETYQWRVGNDQNVSTRSKFSLFFTELVQNVEVRLIAKRAAGECPSDQEAVDTVFHTFSVVPWSESAILGSYVGHYERTPHLTDTVEISYAETAENPYPFGEFLVRNVNRGCDREKYPHQACPRWHRGYSAFAIFTDLCKMCPGTRGLIRLIDPNTVEANITYGDTTQWGSWPLPQLQDKFTGIRLGN